MAKFRQTILVPDNGLWSIYWADPLSLTAHNKRSATYVLDNADQDEIVILGRDLSYKQGELTGGTITKITYQNSAGENYATISDLHMNARKVSDPSGDAFYKALYGDDTIRGSDDKDNMYASRGDDVMFGYKGNDVLSGNEGNDTFTGGKGSDLFVWGPGFGRDVVTDFDAVGGGVAQDYFFDAAGPYEIRKRGHDTIIDCGNGDMLILLNVKFSDVTAADSTI